MANYLGPNAPLPKDKRIQTNVDKSTANLPLKTGYQMTPSGPKPIPGFSVTNTVGSTTVDPNARFKKVEPVVAPTTSQTQQQVEQPQATQIDPVTGEQYLTPENLISGQMQETASLAEKYGLTKGPTTIEELVQKYKQDQSGDVAYLQQQQSVQAASDEAQLNQMKNQGEAAIAGTTAALAQSREGATGTSAPLAANAFSTEMGKRFQQAQSQVEAAQATRNRAMEDLKKAQESGDQELAQKIQGQIASAEMAILQAQNENLSLLATANEQSLAMEANTRANLQSFTSMVDSGTTMDMNGLYAMSQTLNIPLETAFSYYQGAENIRNDKTLDQETKAVQLGQLKVDLDNAIRGVTTGQAQNAEYLKGLYSSGASADEISNVKQLLGITDQNDPMYQIELRKATAQTTMEEAKAKNFGKPPLYGEDGYWDYKQGELDYNKSVAEYNELTGNDGAYRASMDDVYNSTFPVGEEGGWCGVYASTISTGPAVGNMWSEKIQKVVKQDNPTQGNKLLLPIGVQTDAGSAPGEYGHVATVLDFDNVTGNITVVESNKDGRQNRGEGLGVVSIGIYNINQLQSQYGENWGFTEGELKGEYKNQIDSEKKALKDALPSGDTVYGKFEQQAKDLGLTDAKDIKKFADDQLSASYGSMTGPQGAAYNAYLMMSENEGLYNNLMKKVDPVEFADSMNWLSSKVKEGEGGQTITSDLINSLELSPETQQAIMSEMRWLEAALREESGAAISVGEYVTKGRMFFPRYGDDEQTLKDKERQRQLAIEGKKGKMGPAGIRMYEEIGKPLAPTDPDKNPFMTIDLESPEDVLSMF